MRILSTKPWPGGLGFPRGAITDEIYKKVEKLGLELCPAETGPHYRLKYKDQPLGEWFSIGMNQIAGRFGRPSVFRLERDGGSLWLSGAWVRPGSGWDSDSKFIFRLRPSTSLRTGKSES